MGSPPPLGRSSARLRRGSRAHHHGGDNAPTCVVKRRDRRDRKRADRDSALSHHSSRTSCLPGKAAAPIGGARSTQQGRVEIAWKLVDGVGRSADSHLHDLTVTGTLDTSSYDLAKFCSKMGAFGKARHRSPMSIIMVMGSSGDSTNP
jgi:hypothetical protein